MWYILKIDLNYDQASVILLKFLVFYWTVYMFKHQILYIKNKQYIVNRSPQVCSLTLIREVIQKTTCFSNHLQALQSMNLTIFVIEIIKNMTTVPIKMTILSSQNMLLL